MSIRPGRSFLIGLVGETNGCKDEICRESFVEFFMKAKDVHPNIAKEKEIFESLKPCQVRLVCSDGANGVVGSKTFKEWHFVSLQDHIGIDRSSAITSRGKGKAYARM